MIGSWRWSQTTQAHVRPLLTSHLPTFHCQMQVTWPSSIRVVHPQWKSTEILHSKGMHYHGDSDSKELGPITEPTTTSKVFSNGTILHSIIQWQRFMKICELLQLSSYPLSCPPPKHRRLISAKPILFLALSIAKEESSLSNQDPFSSSVLRFSPQVSETFIHP